MARVGPGGILAATIAGRPRRGELGEGAAAACGEPVDRAGQRVSGAPALVSQQCDGRVARRRFRRGGEGPALPLPGPIVGAQAGSVRVAPTEVGGSVSRRL